MQLSFPLANCMAFRKEFQLSSLSGEMVEDIPSGRQPRRMTGNSGFAHGLFIQPRLTRNRSSFAEDWLASFVHRLTTSRDPEGASLRVAAKRSQLAGEAIAGTRG